MVDINEVMRDFQRFTGDGVPGEPLGAPLPIGDPTSGAFTLKKSDLRAWAAWVEQTALSGPPGFSAYEVAVLDGFVGTEADWLASLVGSDAVDAVIPDRLGDFAELITDWDDATSNGFYMGESITNSPASGWYNGIVVAHTVDWVTQEIWSFVADGEADSLRWRREKNSGSWGAWYRVYSTGPEIQALAGSSGWSLDYVMWDHAVDGNVAIIGTDPSSPFILGRDYQIRPAAAASLAQIMYMDIYKQTDAAWVTGGQAIVSVASTNFVTTGFIGLINPAAVTKIKTGPMHIRANSIFSDSISKVDYAGVTRHLLTGQPVTQARLRFPDATVWTSGKFELWSRGTTNDV